MKKEMISEFVWEDICVRYLQDEEGKTGLLLIPATMRADVLVEKEYDLEPLVQVKLEGDKYPNGYAQGRTMRNSESVTRMRYREQRLEQTRWGESVHTVLTDERGYEYEHILSYDKRSPSIECSTKMTNYSNESIVIEMLSSFTLGGMTPFIDGLAEGRLTLHRIRSTWSAEGRLSSMPVEELQLEPSWQKYSANSIRFGQTGSMPIRGFAPFAAVSDSKTGVTWAAALTQGCSWQLEAYRRDDALILSGGLADMEFGHWKKILKQEETIHTPRVVLTVTAGDVSIAAQRITENMRKAIDLPQSEKKLPIIFNEFCTTWGNPTAGKIRKMSEILKGRGITYFVIDAGWYNELGETRPTMLGEWDVKKSRFPEGIKKITDAVRACGMLPGIWFEFEISGEDSATFHLSDRLLKRDDIVITAGARRFWDFRQEEVRKYLAEKVISFLKENKFFYLKVDYNGNIGVGCDGCESMGEGLRQQIDAVQEFFRQIHRELPELVIENCASGGHRLVASFTEITSMSSFSDAHECDEIPIIAANMHRMILPRQSQIWAVFRKGNPATKYYYQLSAAMLGRLCISGDIDKLSADEWEIIEEGIHFYRLAVPVIDQGVSYYYGPHILSYRMPKGWQAVVRYGKGMLTLAVIHTFHESPNVVRVPLMENMHVKGIYAREGLNLRLKDGYLEISGLKEFDGLAVLLIK